MQARYVVAGRVRGLEPEVIIALVPGNKEVDVLHVDTSLRGRRRPVRVRGRRPARNGEPVAGPPGEVARGGRQVELPERIALPVDANVGKGRGDWRMVGAGGIITRDAQERPARVAIGGLEVPRRRIGEAAMARRRT